MNFSQRRRKSGLVPQMDGLKPPTATSSWNARILLIQPPIWAGHKRAERQNGVGWGDLGTNAGQAANPLGGQPQNGQSLSIP